MKIKMLSSPIPGDISTECPGLSYGSHFAKEKSRL